MTRAPHDLMTAIQELLEHERVALLQGDFNAMAELLEEKTALFEELKTTLPGTPHQLPTLRDTALRNQALLDEALQGIRSVVDRMSELQRVRDRLETYDKSGQLQTIKSQKQTFERRA